MSIYENLSNAVNGLIQLAHSWYPGYCCSNQDCHPIPCEEVHELANGTYEYAGYIFQADRVKESLDQFCHACYNPTYEALHHGICLFLKSLT